MKRTINQTEVYHKKNFLTANTSQSKLWQKTSYINIIWKLKIYQKQHKYIVMINHYFLSIVMRPWKNQRDKEEKVFLPINGLKNGYCSISNLKNSSYQY